MTPPSQRTVEQREHWDRKKQTHGLTWWLHDNDVNFITLYEGVSKIFRTGRLERELQMIELSPL
jgi:hypothetical protein